MTNINYRHPPENNEKLKLPQTMGILTMNEFIDRNKDKIDDILDLNFKKIDTKHILYTNMLNNYLESENSVEIIEYFKNVDNLELIDFVQNYLFNNDNKKQINILGNDILNKLILLDEKQNNILLFLLTDLRFKNIPFGNRYEENPKGFLNKYSENIEIDGKKYYKVSADYYAEYSFENNSDGKGIQIGEIKDNKFIGQEYKDLLNNNELNTFGEKKLNLILSLSHIPKIKKFLEEWLLMRIIDIPLKSQVYLFKYLMNTSDYKVDKYKRVIAKNWNIHNEIQQAFFAVSENEEMSEIILKIADSDISEEDKKNIFDKYNFLIDTIFEEINEQFGYLESEDKKEIFQVVIKKLNLLFNDINIILEDSNNLGIEKINTILENTQKDFIKSGVIFKSLKEKNINSLDDLNEIGIDYEKVNSLELSKERKKEILKYFRTLYEDNYDLKTQGVFIDEMIDGIEKSLNSVENIDFYLFYINDKPILSGYFKEDKKTGDKYFGGFNGASSFEGYSIGFWALEKILQEQGENSDINALILSDTNGVENIFKSFLKIKYTELGFELGETIKEGSSNFIKIKRNKKQN